MQSFAVCWSRNGINNFKYFNKTADIDSWFEYMDQFDKYCDISWMNSQECSKKIISDMGITQNMNLGNDYSNMMEWRRSQVKTGIMTYPDLSVNGLKHQ